MKRNEVFPSKYLKAADLNGKPVVATIKAAPLEVLKGTDGKEQSKIVLYFDKAKKTLPLNRVNWDAVAEIAGDDTEKWPGSKIELYPTTTEMAGKRVDCIRIRPPTGLLPLTKAAPPPVIDDGGDDMDDEIPF